MSRPIVVAVRTPSYRAALTQLLRAGTWVARPELDRCSSCAPALDDALADLVATGMAEYRRDVGYRIAQPALVRQAAQDLMANPTLRHAVQVQVKADGTHVALAQRHDELGIVLARVTLPPPADPSLEASLLQSQAVLDAFAHTHGKEAAHG